MNKLNRTKQAQVIAALVEGNSIRSIEPMTGVAKHTMPTQWRFITCIITSAGFIKL